MKTWLKRLSNALGLNVRQGLETPAPAVTLAVGEEDLLDEPTWQSLGPFVEGDVKPLLKDCPHCGNKRRVEMVAFLDGPDPIAWTHCTGCGVSGPSAWTPHEAVTKWNALPRRGDP